MTADPEPRHTAVVDGVGVAQPRYLVHGMPRARYVPVLGLLILVLACGYTVIGVLDKLVGDAVTYSCPPDCGRPPNAVPVASLPRFTSPDGGFSVAYPAPGSAYEVTTQSNGVTARLTAGGGGVMRLFSEPAKGRVARRVVEDLVRQEYPGATVAYQLPNAMVGYQVGYGEVANFQPPGLATRFEMRLIVMAAVKNDLALIAVAEGPFRQFTQDFGPGPPSPANLEIAMDMGKYVDSFRWKGDPPQ